MKSKFLSNIFFCHTMTPRTPCRVQPSLNRCQPPKVESGENLKKVTYQCWLNTKTCDIMASHSSSVFGQRSPDAPPPLFPIFVHNGNVEILIKTLSANTCCFMVKTQWYLLWLQLCQRLPLTPFPAFIHTEAMNLETWLDWDPLKLQSVCKHHDYYNLVSEMCFFVCCLWKQISCLRGHICWVGKGSITTDCDYLDSFVSTHNQLLPAPRLTRNTRH